MGGFSVKVNISWAWGPGPRATPFPQKLTRTLGKQMVSQFDGNAKYNNYWVCCVFRFLWPGASVCLFSYFSCKHLPMNGVAQNKIVHKHFCLWAPAGGLVICASSWGVKLASVMEVIIEMLASVADKSSGRVLSMS